MKIVHIKICRIIVKGILRRKFMELITYIKKKKGLGSKMAEE